MPMTLVHFGVNLIVYFILSLFLPIQFLIINCFYLLLAELIDIDHLFSKPIYHPRRNPFKTHFLHKNWRLISTISMLLFLSPIYFLGIGLISHLFIDWIYTNYWLKV